MKKQVYLLSALSAAFFMSCSVLQSSTEESTSKYTYLTTAIEKFDELDTDENGKLSLSEAKGELAEHFSDIDSDEDGELSLSELVAYKKSLQE